MTEPTCENIVLMLAATLGVTAAAATVMKDAIKAYSIMS
jgi:hypothetical protein